jgi:hypothetical protein
MAVKLSPLAGAGWQFFDNLGTPLAGGLLYTYTAGTTTPQATYTSAAGTIANTNPIVLDAAGRTANQTWLTTGGAYKFVLQTPAAVTIGTYDNISGINDLTGATGSTSITTLGTITAGTWNATPIGIAYGGTGLTSPGANGNVLTSNGTAWYSAAGAGGVSSISFGSTGLTPSTATGGAVTVAGTLVAGNGGTGLSAPGTAGNVLTSNGTIWTSSAPASVGGIVFINTLTASTSATIDFTGLSGYSKYLIIFENVFTSTSGTLSLRFGTGATPTYLTSNYGFQYSGVTSGSSTTGDRITLVSSLAATSSVAPGMSGSLFVEGMLSGYTSVQGLFYYTDVSSGSQYSSLVSSGTNHNSTVAKTALRFLPNSGNIGSGTFSLYGINS